MEIVRDEIRFEAPVGWKDITDYTFRNAIGDERLTVDINSSEDEPSSLTGTLNERKESLLALFGESVQIYREEDTRVGSFPARRLIFSVKTEEFERFFCFAIATLDAEQRIELAYETPLDRGKYETCFERIQDSVRFRSSLPNDNPDGFTARYVGPILLFVPTPLAPPQSYFFVDEDRAGQIQVALWNKAEEPPLSAFPHAALITDGDGQQKVDALPLNGISATASRSVTSQKTLAELIEDVLWESQLPSAGQQQARINGKSPVNREADLLQQMRFVAQSVSA